MPTNARVRTIRLPLRRIGSALPSVALICGGVVLPASTGSTYGFPVGLVSSSSSIATPDIALTRPTEGILPSQEAPARKPLAPLLPPGTAPGSSAPVVLDRTGIPVRALQAYRRAASLVDAADPGCQLDWALPAAIGRVESDHARFGGNQLDSAGVARPGIIGIPLDGANGTARIIDTDRGLLDRDTAYDRAVGPMQFIPGTWRVAGVDADGDGAKNPQDMTDASTATAAYLCSGPGDLSLAGDLHAAVLRYNASDSYVRTVTAIAAAYRHGVVALPASELPAANPVRHASKAATARPSARRHASKRPTSAAPRPVHRSNPRTSNTSTANSSTSGPTTPTSSTSSTSSTSTSSTTSTTSTATSTASTSHPTASTSATTTVEPTTSTSTCTPTTPASTPATPATPSTCPPTTGTSSATASTTTTTTLAEITTPSP